MPLVQEQATGLAHSAAAKVDECPTDASAAEEEAEDAMNSEEYQRRVQQALAKYANVLERVEALESSSSQV